MEAIFIARRQRVNTNALAATLKATLGSDYNSLSTRPDGVILFLAEEADRYAIEQAQTLVREHDPSVLTPEQQATRDRREALRQARLTNRTSLNMNEFVASPEDVQALAERIAWLEMEVRELRDV